VTRRIIAGVGFVAAAVVVVLICIVGILFLVPGTNLFGTTSVVGRQTSTTYYAREIPGIRDLLISGNIMIESNYIPIEINVSKHLQHDELSIQVWENSTGLSFNSIQRTHIEWGQTLVPRDCGKREMFYVVRVIEPSGIINRRDDVIVINLPSTDENEANRSGYNFILNTGRSVVTFTSDDDDIVHANPLNIGNLEIRNASGIINLPAAPADGAKPSFHANINNVTVDTRGVILNCRSPISGDVLIKCDAGTFLFGDIGGKLHVEGRTNANGGINNVSVLGQTVIGGDVVIRGNSVIFNRENRRVDVDGKIDFRADNGSFAVTNSGHIEMDTMNAHLTGLANGVVRSLNYKASGLGTVTMAQVGSGENLGSDDKVVVKTDRGNIIVRKVWLDTDVESVSGTITVAFDVAIIPAASGMPSLKIRAYDGAVTASNIVGTPDIFIKVNGRAKVDAHFRQVLTNEQNPGRIEYEGSTRRGRNIGNIDVRFYRNIPYCILFVEYTRGAHNRTNPSILTTMQHAMVARDASLVNNTSYHVRYASRVGDQPSTGNLRISTSNTLNVFTSNA
jgi:hypothetical protein